jgi:hypothetical protein
MDRSRCSHGSARCTGVTGAPTRPASPGSNAWPRWGTHSAVHCAPDSRGDAPGLLGAWFLAMLSSHTGEAHPIMTSHPW